MSADAVLILDYDACALLQHTTHDLLLFGHVGVLWGRDPSAYHKRSKHMQSKEFGHMLICLCLQVGGSPGRAVADEEATVEVQLSLMQAGARSTCRYRSNTPSARSSTDCCRLCGKTAQRQQQQINSTRVLCTAGMSWGDEVAIEVEALQATYGHELHVDGTLQQISMTVLPQQDHTQQQHFVQCQLQLTLPAAYPAEQPPDIQLQDVRGFVNRQEQLQQLLAADAVELTGELLLGLLFETTKAWLTDNNWPEGKL